MSTGKWSVLGIVITLGGLSAGWGQPYGAVVAIGIVIALIGDELIQAVKSLRDAPEEGTEPLAIDITRLPSALAATAIFGEMN